MVKGVGRNILDVPSNVLSNDDNLLILYGFSFSFIQKL
jgi:hypothetical protein